MGQTIKARSRADAALRATEASLVAHGDRIIAGDRVAIEQAMVALKAVNDGDDAIAINARSEALIEASMRMGEDMYAATPHPAGPEAGAIHGVAPRPIRSNRTLFEPTAAGALELANRIVMAPLTRNRAGPGLVPGPFAAEYYAQRATAGLIIAEATQVSVQAQGYSGTPGCYTGDQVAGWRVVTDAVHARGGMMVVQLWHTGRISHTSFQKDGAAPVAPSAIKANAKTFVSGEGFVEVSTPRALRPDELPGIVEDFRHAAACARAAGFDGVEVHGAHGYLLDAFLRDGANQRTDAYGGSVANRARLLVEVARACAEAIGAGRVGVRISPVSTAGDSHDSDPQALFNHVVEALSPLGLAYVHVVEGETGGARDSLAFDYAALRQRFDGVWMVNNGFDRAMAIAAVASGRADLVSFGRLYMANPDLVERLREDAALNPLMGPETFYGGGAHGYTDYPALEPVWA